MLRRAPGAVEMYERRKAPLRTIEAVHDKDKKRAAAR